MLRYASVIVDGQTIAYATDGTGPPLVLLHGLGFDHSVWATVAPFLIGHFRVLIPDLPGIGRSQSALWDGNPEMLTRSIAGFLTATQSVPAFLAGTGLGGTLALALASRYPERVRALALTGAPGLQLWPATGQGQMIQRVSKVPGLLGFVVRLWPARHARQLLRDSLATGEPPADQVAAVAAILSNPRSRAVVVQALVRLEAWQAALRQVGGIRAPTLLIWGEHDALYGLPGAERLRHSIPGSQLISIAATGHAVTIERPAELAEALRRFFGPAGRR